MLDERLRPYDALLLTATTTAPNQTVTLQRLTPAGRDITVDWGDGTADTTIVNGNTGVTTHQYALSGTYTIRVSNPEALTYLDLRDPLLAWVVGPASPMPAGLTSLSLIALPDLTWVVGSSAGAAMPAGLTSLQFNTLPGLTWEVGSSAGAAMPAGLIYLYFSNIANVSWVVRSGTPARGTGCRYLHCFLDAIRRRVRARNAFHVLVAE